MLENRPIVIITIGYIIGILMGLYYKKSIALLYFGIYIIYLILKPKKTKKFKLISFKRYFRYVKIIITKNVFMIIIISSIISNSITISLNNKYENLYKNLDKTSVKVEAIVVSIPNEKQYKDVYKIKVEKINSNIKYENTYLYLNVKTKNIKFEYGDNIIIIGEFKYPSTRKNYKGFDYKQYLKSIKILGSIDLKVLESQEKAKNISILKLSNKAFLKIRELIKNNYEKDIADVIMSITFGYTNQLDEEIKENFLESNLADVMAVSGLHIGYLIIFAKFIFEKMAGKRVGRIITIFVIIIYMCITGFSESVVRATIMAILLLFSGIVYRKSDIWQNLSLALLILLIYNPFSILNVSTILTFGATIGIVSRISKSVTISATIAIFPIIMIFFNKIYLSSFIISIIIGVLIGLIVIGGLIFVVFYKMLEILMIKNSYVNILGFIIKSVINLAEVGSNLPLNQIYVTTPSVISIILYYLFIFIFLNIYKIYKEKHPNVFQKRIRNLVALLKFRIKQNKNKIISSSIIIVIIILTLSFIPPKMKIYFIDVGQGDSSLIITPKNKKILIDGGGSEFGDFDVGKNILVPYLLDRKIKTLDYIIISHFDTDHCQGILYVMEKLNVRNIIIGKQYDKSKNFEKFINIAKKRNIKIDIAKRGDRLNIEKNIYFDVIWPDEKNMISDNWINNNSLVCKLNYKEFSILFTGDIEKIAEKAILEKYGILKSTILKIAHHGSKTSSTIDFLKNVAPKVALIGVGEDNNFGHPSSQTIENLEKMNILIYRTDLMGEIAINTDGFEYKISKFVNNNK